MQWKIHGLTVLWVFAKSLWPTSAIVGSGGGSLLLPKRSSTCLNTSLKPSAQQDGDPDKLWSRGSLNSKLLSDMFSPLTGRLDTWHQPGRISKSFKWSTKRSPHWQTLLMLCQESIMLLSPQSSQSSTFLRQWWQCRKMIQISHDQ